VEFKRPVAALEKVLVLCISRISCCCVIVTVG